MMRITPLEIRQKTFEKIFRGYDKDEVTEFLILLSQEWEKINDEKKTLEMRYEQSQKESEKLRQVEGSLFRTLKSAEDTGATIIEEANRTAEQIVNEARVKAEALKAEAERKARQLLEEAESNTQNILEDLRQDVSALLESYETLLAQREIVIKNLKSIASETFEAVNIAEEELQHIDIAAHARVMVELDKKGSSTFTSEVSYTHSKQTIVTDLEPEKEEVLEEEAEEMMNTEHTCAETRAEEVKEAEKAPEEAPKRKENGSFFDQFD